ncbi:MAG TPA: hypothetical protein VMB51_13405 [Solirubrobacteraceae bacterium]|nr:hypothetical protein [Solirubrobacteraceae bacterium]
MNGEPAEQFVGATGQPADESGQPVAEPGQPPGEPGQPAGESGQRAGESGQRAGESGQRAGESEQPAGEPGQPVGETGQPTEQELREAYEAELGRITSAEMVLQAAVSLLNIGGYRLGLASGPGADAGPERDLDQVRDAIDGVRGLMPVLERAMPAEIAPLRDALSRLQMAYAREAAQTAAAAPSTPAGEPAPAGDPAAAPPPQPNPAPGSGQTEDKEPRKGPAETSGRLWVPGR